MHKTLRRLPSLDFLRGFEAAGRRLSFTLAAEELFVTQSALSRQVKALEDALGVALFVRRHRALALTPAGAAFHRSGHRKAARSRRRGRRRARRRTRDRVSRSPRPSRSPRCGSSRGCRVSRGAPGRRGVRVRRRPARRPGARRRRRRGPLPRRRRRAGDAVRLFGERLLPVASPALVKRGAAAQAARRPRAPRAHPPRRSRRLMPWLNWPAWLDVERPAGLKPAGTMRFSLYDQVIQATRRRAGRGARPHSAHRRTDARRPAVAPFPKRYDSPRGYFAMAAPHAAQRPEVAAFIQWLRSEAARTRRRPRRGRPGRDGRPARH